MIEEQMQKVAMGLALIVPAVLLLRWFLTRNVGSPEEVAQQHIARLRHKLERGEIDQAAFDKQVADIAED